MLEEAAGGERLGRDDTRRIALVALLLVAACATTPTATASKAEPATTPATTPAATVAPAALTIEFASAEATRTGGAVVETVYAEKPGDAAISARTFADGVLTYAGQVGFGKGSAWAGIGFSWDVAQDGSPLDASAYQSITFRLAGTTGTLRLRLVGDDKETRGNGCYPIFVQRVSPKVEEYTIPFSRFAAESWCGTKARAPKDVLRALTGFEVASPDMTGKPITLSAGAVRLNP